MLLKSAAPYWTCYDVKQCVSWTQFVQAQLDENTALLAAGHTAVCCFVNDDLSVGVVERLAEVGVK